MKLTWSVRAEANLHNIVKYIAKDDPVAGQQLANAIVNSTVATLTEYPNAGRQGRVDGTREWVAHKNYIVAYRIDKSQKIQILSVVHSSRLWPQDL